MPLDERATRLAFIKNLEELDSPGASPRPAKQKLAIAYAVQRRARRVRKRKPKG